MTTSRLTSLVDLSVLSGSEIPSFKLSSLPWDRNALTPFISAKTIILMYDEYYVNNVDKLNKLAWQYPDLKSQTIAQIVANYPVGTLFNNIAAEILNHEFFMRCLSPKGGIPSGRLYQTIVQQFKSFENFVAQFTERAVSHFGSGWVWLVFDPTTSFLMIVDGDNAYNPIVDGYIPLLALDIWEHAYILDYGTNKRGYVDNFWKFINWIVPEGIAAEQIFNYQLRIGTS